jgi:hypothetical protein
LCRTSQAAKKQLEPSWKWKNLGLASPYEYVIIPLHVLEVFGIFAALHVLYAFGNVMLEIDQILKVGSDAGVCALHWSHVSQCVFSTCQQSHIIKR